MGSSSRRCFSQDSATSRGARPGTAAQHFFLEADGGRLIAQVLKPGLRHLLRHQIWCISHTVVFIAEADGSPSRQLVQLHLDIMWEHEQGWR